jgi:hypothetical protein
VEEEECVPGFGGGEAFLWETLLVQYGSIDANNV